MRQNFGRAALLHLRGDLDGHVARTAAGSVRDGDKIGIELRKPVNDGEEAVRRPVPDGGEDLKGEGGTISLKDVFDLHCSSLQKARFSGIGRYAETTRSVSSRRAVVSAAMGAGIVWGVVDIRADAENGRDGLSW